MADPVHNLALSENRVPHLQPQQGFAQRNLPFVNNLSARDGLSLALFNTSSVKPRNENSLRRHPEKATFAILNDPLQSIVDLCLQRWPWEQVTNNRQTG